MSHDVIHSYDLTDALARPCVVTADRAAAVLTAFRPLHLRGFGTDLGTTRFEATNDDLAIGPDPQKARDIVRAPLLDLIPIATGRRPRPADHR